MIHKGWKSLGSLVGLLSFGVSAQALDLGDPAPPLTISEWVQGEPIDMKKGQGKKVYLVEFWAVWCPPCKITVPRLTEIQQKYKDDLVIIGVTAPDARGNSPDAVRKFVRSQGDAMRYHVALDKAEATTNAYMASSNVMGIPFAFLVGKDGNIAWMDSPLNPELDEVLPKIISGEYDVRTAKTAALIQRRLPSVISALQRGNTEGAWDGLVDILKMDPGSETALDLLTRIYMENLRDKKAFRSWVSSHISTYKNNVAAMYRLAEALCNITDLSMAVPDLALEAAADGYKAGQRDPAAIAAYARALFQIGKLDRAITLQQDALAAADSSRKEQLQGVLDYYNQCKQLQGSSN